MAAEEHVGSRRSRCPPRGEPVHLPDPSYLPVLVALGITIAVVGVVVNWVMFGIGVAITVYCDRPLDLLDARRTSRDLPLEH